MQLQALALRSTNAERLASFQEVIRCLVAPDWEKGPWVAGGCIRRLLMDQDPFASDVDVFFASETQKDEWVETVKRRHPMASVSSRENNVTIDIPELPGLGLKSLKLQAIHIAYYSTPQAVIDSFDYTICQLVTDGHRLETGEFTLWDLARKRLVLHKMEHAVATMRRMIKYTKQGFYACSGTMGDLLSRVAANPAIIDDKVISID